MSKRLIKAETDSRIEPKGRKKPKLKVLQGGQDISPAVEREIQRRLELIKDHIVKGKNGKKVIITDAAFSTFVDVPKNTIRQKMQQKGRYEEQFIDGDISFVEFTRGYKGRKEFELEEAVTFLETKLRKKEELVDVHKIAKGIKLSHTWIKRFFKEHGTESAEGKQIEIEIEGKKHFVSLSRSKRPFMAGKKPLYMIRSEYELFKRWIEINYKLERTWDPDNIRPETPKGWYSTIQTAKKLGFRDAQLVRLRLTSGKLRGKEFHGITIISGKEIARFKRLREELKSPEGCIKVSVMLESNRLSESQYDKATEKTEEGKRDFIIKNRNGETKRFTIHIDIDGHRWINEKDAACIENIMNSKKALIRKEKTAEILGISSITLEQNMDPINKVAKYNLSNGKSVEISFIVDKNICLFDEEEVIKAKNLENNLKKNMKLIPDIAKALGLSSGSTKHWIEDLNHVFEFNLNGKEYKIEIRKGKFGALFLYGPEFSQVIKWKKMISQQTHYMLNSRKICRNHIRQRILLSLYDEKNGEIVLQNKGNSKVTIPVEQVDGEPYIKKGYAEIIDFFFDINGIYLHTRKRAVDGLVKGRKQDRDITTTKLILLKEAIKNENNLKFKTTVEELLNDLVVMELMEREITDPEMHQFVQVRLNSLFIGHTGVKKEIIPLGDKNMGVYPLAPDYGIVVPVTEKNGDIKIDVRDSELVDLYLGLFYPVNGESFATASSYLRKVDKMEELNPRTRAGLWIVRQFAINNFSLVGMDLEEGKYLFDKLEEPTKVAVWARMFDNFSRYSIQTYPIRPKGMPGNFSGAAPMQGENYERAISYVAMSQGDLAGTYS